MKYIFVINGRADIKKKIEADLPAQLEGKHIDYEQYVTTGIGDGIRFVRIYCDLHTDERICFVACGGTGTVNEVASGIVGFKNKCMAILDYGETSDFLKNFPERDFHSLDKILRGEETQIDIMRANDNYAINVINVGFDSYVALEATERLSKGESSKKAYNYAILNGLLGHRFNRMQIIADGVPLNRKRMLLCTMGNGKWCAGQFICSPRAVLDDGLIEVCLFKVCSIARFLYQMMLFRDGSHLDKNSRTRLVYRRARHVQVRSEDLIFICIDGEMTASTSFDITVLPKEIHLILPAQTI